MRRLLGLKPGEGRTVGLAVAVSFFESAGLMIAQSAVDALFFARYGVEKLPVMYLLLGVAMFADTPYAYDALGTRPSFEKTTAADLKKFHDTWYAPNNAILVVLGDVDPQATLTEIKSLFGTLKPKKLPPRPRIHLQAPQAVSFTVDTTLGQRRSDRNTD